MVARVGPPATASREPRQARKGATVAVTPGAGMWLARAASRLFGSLNTTQVTGSDQGSGFVTISGVGHLAGGLSSALQVVHLAFEPTPGE